MSEQHTPGPWREEPLPNSRIGIRADDHGYVCIVECGGPNPDRNAAQQANAHVLADAPAMLALLQELIDIEGPQPGTSDWAAKVRAIIASATGAA